MKKVILIVLVAIVIFPALTQSQSTPSSVPQQIENLSDDLKVYDMQDEAFSIVFPTGSKVEEYGLTMKDNYGQMRIKVMQGKAKDVLFNLSYGRYPINFVKDNSVKEIFEESFQTLLKTTQSQALNSKDEQWQGYPAFYFEVKDASEMLIKGRFVLVEDKIFQLTAYVNKFSLESSVPKVQTVLESLKINR